MCSKTGDHTQENMNRRDIKQVLLKEQEAQDKEATKKGTSFQQMVRLQGQPHFLVTWTVGGRQEKVQLLVSG